MSQIQSNNIRIFPSSGRATTTQRYGDNFVTEYNLSSIVNKLLAPYSQNNNKGFVITTDPNASGPFEFNINGYFVSVSGSGTGPNKTVRDAITDIVNMAESSVNTATTANEQNFVTFVKSGDNKVISAVIHPYNPSIDSNAISFESPYVKLAGWDYVSGASAPTMPEETSTLAILEDIGSGGTSNWQPCANVKLRFANININDGEL